MLIKKYVKNNLGTKIYDIINRKLYDYFILIFKKSKSIKKIFLKNKYFYLNNIILIKKFIKILFIKYEQNYIYNFEQINRNLLKNNKTIVWINIFNSNIITNITDTKGNIKYTTSTSMQGFKGYSKIQYQALKVLIKKIKLKLFNIKNITVHINGFLKNRKLVTKNLKYHLNINTIKYKNYQPHNGCRAKKKKRK